MTETSSPIQLQFAAPRRGKPPRHFADLTKLERIAVLAELGEKPFRATQLATHYFSHLSCDPAAMTDLPAAAHRCTCHEGRRRHDRQDPLAPVRLGQGRVGPDALPGPRHAVRLQPGRLRDCLLYTSDAADDLLCVDL